MVLIERGADIDAKNNAGKTVSLTSVRSRLHWCRHGPIMSGLTVQAFHKGKTYMAAAAAAALGLAQNSSLRTVRTMTDD
jgi:hypothetical protein